MSYVIYTKSVAVHERQRSPAGKLAAWFYSRAAGTFLQSVLSFLFFQSPVVRLATAITIGMLLALALDFTFTFFPVGHPTAFYLVCATVGMLAGLGTHGAGGGIIGCVWGWLIGGVTDTVASEFVSNPVDRISVKVIAWLVTCLIGWLAGLVVTWAFERFVAPRRRLRRVIVAFVILLTLASVAIFLYRMFGWTTSTYPILSASRQWVVIHWRGLVVALAWIIAVLVPVIWCVRWLISGVVMPNCWFREVFPRRDVYSELGVYNQGGLAQFLWKRDPLLEYLVDEIGWMQIITWSVWIVLSVLLSIFLI